MLSTEQKGIASLLYPCTYEEFVRWLYHSWLCFKMKHLKAFCLWVQICTEVSLSAPVFLFKYGMYVLFFEH